MTISMVKFYDDSDKTVRIICGKCRHSHGHRTVVHSTEIMDLTYFEEFKEIRKWKITNFNEEKY